MKFFNQFFLCYIAYDLKTVKLKSYLKPYLEFWSLPRHMGPETGLKIYEMVFKHVMRGIRTVSKFML